MHIPKNALVLEIGSGNRPYPRSDVLCDKYLTNSGEREMHKQIIIDRPFVIAEAEHLPFKNKAFDYVIASHVLEHAQNPRLFLNELTRVGKSGYIETPLPLRERVFNWSFHRWYVFIKNHRLILIRKTGKSKKYYHGLSADKIKSFHILEGKTLLNLKLEWHKNIKYTIYESEPEEFLTDLDYKLLQSQTLTEELKQQSRQLHPICWLKNNLFPMKIALINKIQLNNRHPEIDILNLIVCPKCKHDLISDKKTLKCLFCLHKYAYKFNRIPYLIYN